MSVIKTILQPFAGKATVIVKTKIAAHTYQLTCSLHKAFKNYTPGQQLRILVGGGRFTGIAKLVRTYSIWNYDTTKTEIDLAICTFSGGPGARWAEAISVNDTVYFSGPKGKFIIEEDWETYLFIGDVSALALFYKMSRHLKHKNCYGWIYSDDKKNFFEDIGSVSHCIKFLQLTSDASFNIISKLAALNLDPAKSVAYIGGETTFCRDMDNYFRQMLHWNVKQIKTKPFWNTGKRGLK